MAVTNHSKHHFRRRIFITILTVIFVMGFTAYASHQLFRRFMWRAKQVEARVELSRIHKLELAYREKHLRYYGPGPDRAPILLTMRNFADYVDDQSCIQRNELGFTPKGKCMDFRYSFEITKAGTDNYTAIARELKSLPQNRRPAPICDQDFEDEWRIDEQGVASSVNDSVFNCTKVLFW